MNQHTPNTIININHSFKKGDMIGNDYKVLDVLGEGGFGIVYLVQSNDTKRIFALKTFRDKFMEDVETRKRFRKEAQIWVNLESHTYLVKALSVNEVLGRLYIAMEYYAPDEKGINTLSGYIRNYPPGLPQIRRWVIQFCYGMEYAYSKGIKAHRDIKPANIMLDYNKILKITDFGLAGVFVDNDAGHRQGHTLEVAGNSILARTENGVSAGTPEYMAPEQFEDISACDERSDIYSFGIVLYQMASGGKLPFIADNSNFRWATLKHFHCEKPVPKLISPLFPIISICLEKEPARRFQSFKALREEFESHFHMKVRTPIQQELDWLEWAKKGNSFRVLKLYGDAIECYNQALILNEDDYRSWNNKGMCMQALGLFEESIVCFENTIRLNPVDTIALSNKGISLSELGSFKNAFTCFDSALKIDPNSCSAWIGKGCILAKDGSGHTEESIACFNRALAINPQNIAALHNKGYQLSVLGRHREAINCFDEVHKIDPLYSNSWYYKGLCFAELELFEEELFCFNKVVELDKNNSEAYYFKGMVEEILEKNQEAIISYNRALAINPQKIEALYSKGVLLFKLKQDYDAKKCFDEVHKIDPLHSENLYCKGLCEAELGLKNEAIHSLKKFIKLAPLENSEQNSKRIQFAQKKIKELE